MCDTWRTRRSICAYRKKAFMHAPSGANSIEWTKTRQLRVLLLEELGQGLAASATGLRF
jgi:hypothetical protein